MPLGSPIPLTERLRRRVERDFAAGELSGGAIDSLERVDLGDWLSTQPPDGRERVLAAILVIARGDSERLASAIETAERDWRDALVWGELAQPDWPVRLEVFLGPR
jgi:hypothetical protein